MKRETRYVLLAAIFGPFGLALFGVLIAAGLSLMFDMLGRVFSLMEPWVWLLAIGWVVTAFLCAGFAHEVIRQRNRVLEDEEIASNEEEKSHGGV